MVEGFKDEATDLVKYGGLLFVATIAANVLNYLFHMILSRLLGPAQYGAFNSLIALFLIISIPLETIKTVITKYVSNLYVHHNYGEIKYLVFMASKRLLKGGILSFLCISLFSNHISSFLKVPSKISVIILGGVISLNLLIPVCYGLLQGLERFVTLGLNILISTFSRVLFGSLFVLIGVGVSGALGGSIIQNLVAIGLALVSVRYLFKEGLRTEEITREEIYRYSIPVFLSLLSFAILTNIDMILVKHFFSPVEAGNYSAAALVAKAILFLPCGIIMVMFPKVSKFYTLDQKTYPLLIKALLYGSFLLIVVIPVFLGLPDLIVRLLFGKEYLILTPFLLRILVLAMVPFILSSIIINYNLALHRSSLLFPLIPGVLLETILIWFFHPTLDSAIYILAGNGLLILLSLSLITYLEEKWGARSLS